MNASSKFALRMPRAAAALMACAFALASPARADTVEVRQAGEIGSGSAFRRGQDCLVLTAAHVTPDPALQASVRDRTGASAGARIIHADPAHDVALLQVEGNSVACGGRWPDPAWMASERFSPAQQLYYMRREPGGRETAVMLRWAGGSPTTLTLSPLDKVGAIASDSGALVYLGERPAGIVLAVAPDTGRVDVLRMDTIHSLVGDRFQAGGDALVSLEYVNLRGRANGTWLAYVSTWFGQGGRPRLASAGHPQLACRVGVEVLDMRSGSMRNPEREKAQEKLEACRSNVLFRSVRNLMDVCVSSARAEINRLPSSVDLTTLQMQVKVRDPQGLVHQDLQSFQFQGPQESKQPRSDAELSALTSAFDAMAPGLLRNAGCMKAASPGPPAPTAADPQRRPARRR